ncbi:SAM-dependent methyltransferase [Enterovirga rhinocerotis]|uniref:Cyclopropane-fatty-acyl-phospholipid synthase n=1 Tax=Enterovirga rhinocerotis TaxID=1339210 RepID=A0A4R7C984_9HYPH|nr:cyclopropane-fatty-acyl-phospholipid synthase family protein [Enterovirga rhinocerotis]TDR94592.1 cyclopropane-fatty-acyl-phospholipid synthase [Enterovirga rhinocerotis]
MTTPSEPRLEAFRALLTDLGQTLQADFSIRLWDGSHVPLGPGARDDLAIAINAPQAITRLLRRPRLATVIDLAAEGLLTLEGGTLFDLAARRGAATKGALKRLDKLRAVKVLAPFLFARAGTGAASAAYDKAQPDSPSSGRDDKALVQFHYDLSNAFYGLFLDPEMVYSCAYFPDWETGIEDAQQAKLEMICRKLRLKPGERFLDIGCGWGGLVCHAARHHGVTAHGVTLSQAQFDFAQEKIRRLGLEDRVTIELKDFRELTGTFDKIASIGMFEHVGLANRDAYYRQMRDLLRPRGLLLHHAITRPAKKNARAFRKKRPEYAAIINYVFPGSELDHVGGTVESLERNGFEVHDVEAWREHYARTTKLWCERLYAARETAEAEVGAGKLRLWLLYLAGVSLGFERGTIGIYQSLASRRARGLSGLPPTRADLYADGPLPKEG